jgi:predicted GH43/DUF377 family glycosyl hydrolase
MSSADPTLVRRGTVVLRADPRRVVTKLFLPGQEMLIHGISRADAVIHRVLAMTDEQVSVRLAATLHRFAGRHHDLRAIFAEHFALVEHHLPETADASAERRELIGAYFTKEYSVEAAALFNPSLVAHPDQSGLAAGELRFIMSVRAVGEGHISSIEFRTGVLGPSDDVRIDDPGRHLVTGRAAPATISRDFLRDALSVRADAAAANHLLSLLPARFDATHLDAALASVARDRLTRGSEAAIIERIRWIASCNYQLHFPPDRPLSERLIYPSGADESHGVEDARFTRFIEDDGRVTYYATYTAFDGSHVAPHLLQTDDFQSFDSTQLIGSAANNKGMALFPRRVRGEYLALSRGDRESIGVASSTDARNWGRAVTVDAPEQPWEFIELGNCGPPVETPEGWLVLTHGVGPMHEYGIGAILLDLDEPTTMIGALSQPLLTPTDGERDGYVPNIVYSCGALLHEHTLVLPYGCSDSAIRFAFVDLAELQDRLRAARRHP